MEIEYLSLGAGPPSVALAILNAWGEIQPKAECIVFADTGGEKQETYRLIPVYATWLAEHGYDLVTVQSKDGKLQDYVRERSVPIPIHTESGQGRRQCTDKWKIQPIEQYLHRVYGRSTALTAQLGLAYDMKDQIRMRDPRVKRNRNRYPLVEKKITRAMTVEIIKTAGLPVPPWSACYFCPLQSNGRWQQVASSSPDDFAAAVDLDEFIRERGMRNGKGPLWLHYSRKPIQRLFTSAQAPMDVSVPDDSGSCDSGHCFT